MTTRYNAASGRAPTIEVIEAMETSGFVPKSLHDLHGEGS
jgi:hypothetical protein